MEMQQVRYFLALCDELNLTRAAKPGRDIGQPISMTLSTSASSVGGTVKPSILAV
jgi:hypothetical protein